MLKRKMLRDMGINKVPFIAIFLMMFMGNFIFSGMTSEYNGMRNKFQNYIEETNLADSWLYSQNFNTEVIDKVRSLDEVTKVEERMLIPTTIKGNQKQTIDLLIKKEDTISSLKIIEGEPFDKNKEGIWLDYQFAQANNYQLHDKIQLEYQGIIVEKEILGLAYQPEYIYSVKDNEMLPNHENNGFALMSEKTFPYPQLIQWNQLLVEGTGDLKNSINETIGGENIHLIMQDEHPSYTMINSEIDQHQEIGLLFVVVFLFIAVLVTITTVHRLLNSQRMQIGVLKSLGFNKRQLFSHYISHSTIICLLGSLLGYVLGYLTLPPLILSFIQPMYAVPNLQAVMLPFGFILPISCAILCLLISLLICRKYLKGNAAEILYSNTTSKTYKELPFSNFWRYLSFYSQWNARDILRNKLRSIMSVFGVIGCVALLYGAFGLFTSMDQLTRWNMNKVQTYDTKLSGDFSNVTYTDELIEAMNGETLMESGVEISKDDFIKTATLTAFESQRYVHLMKDFDSEIILTNGIALSKNIADEFKVSVGDQIQWKIVGTNNWVTSEVSAIIRTPMNQGLSITKAEMQRLGIPFQTTSLIGQEIDNSRIDSHYITGVQNREDVEASLNTMMQASMMLCGIFVFAAILLGSVILYNLGTLSYNERYYEMATLKVLGFSNKRIRKLMIQQNLWLTMLGIIIGIPAGQQFILLMVSTIQESMDVMIYIPIYVYLISIVGTYLLSWIINKLLSRKVYHIDMVSALKSSD